MTNDPPWSPGFAEAPAAFHGPTQKARFWTEGWVEAWCFCPACGARPLTRFANNNPIGDFHCGACAEEFELKSTKSRIGRKIVDGAYGAMTERLAARNNPSLMLMNYSAAERAVTNLIVVPKHFFTPEIIERRKPLAATARRAGWVGCNILIGQVPAAGRIHIVRDGRPLAPEAVTGQWRATAFLRETSLEARGWLIEVMKCVEDIGRPQFTLDEVYAFEGRLAALYPGNNNVRPEDQAAVAGAARSGVFGV